MRILLAVHKPRVFVVIRFNMVLTVVIRSDSGLVLDDSSHSDL